MKARGNFLRVVCVLLMFMGGWSTVFGQNQKWLSIGSDFAKPDLDPFLLEHAWYADDKILSSGEGFTLPVNGVSGTPNNNNLGGSLTLGGTDNCIAEPGTARYYMQEISAGGNWNKLDIGANAHLYYNRCVKAINPASRSTPVANVYDHSSVPTRSVLGQTIT